MCIVALVVSCLSCGAKEELWPERRAVGGSHGIGTGGRGGMGVGANTTGSAGNALGGAHGGSEGLGGVPGLGGSEGLGGAPGLGGARASGGSPAGTGGAADTCEGAVTSDVFDPNTVYLLGTLSPGSCGFEAVANFRCPNSAAVGFDCSFLGTSASTSHGAQIRPTDGRMLYARWPEHEIREFTCDGCPYRFPNANNYPRQGVANDVKLETSCKVDTFDPGFLVSPSGEVVYRCVGGDWRDMNDVIVYSEPARTLAHLGYGGVALTRPLQPLFALQDAALFDLRSRRTTFVLGLPSRPVHAVRAIQPSGFIVTILAADGAVPGGVWELWEIDEAGQATRRGQYPPFPAEVLPSPEAMLDPNGILFQIATAPNDVSGVIVRREIGGTTEVVYSEEENPLVQIHISGFLSGP